MANGDICTLMFLCVAWAKLVIFCCTMFWKTFLIILTIFSWSFPEHNEETFLIILNQQRSIHFWDRGQVSLLYFPFQISLVHLAYVVTWFHRQVKIIPAVYCMDNWCNSNFFIWRSLGRRNMLVPFKAKELVFCDRAHIMHKVWPTIIHPGFFLVSQADVIAVETLSL